MTYARYFLPSIIDINFAHIFIKLQFLQYTPLNLTNTVSLMHHPTPKHHQTRHVKDFHVPPPKSIQRLPSLQSASYPYTCYMNPP